MPSVYPYLLLPADESKKDQTEKCKIIISQVHCPTNFDIDTKSHCSAEALSIDSFSSVITVAVVEKEVKQSNHTYLLFDDGSLKQIQDKGNREKQSTSLNKMVKNLLGESIGVDCASKPSIEEVNNALIHMIDQAKKNNVPDLGGCKLYVQKRGLAADRMCQVYMHHVSILPFFENSNLLEPKGWCHWLTGCCASLFRRSRVAGDDTNDLLPASLK